MVVSQILPVQLLSRRETDSWRCLLPHLPRIPKFPFLTSSKVILMLLVQGLHCENHWTKFLNVLFLRPEYYRVFLFWMQCNKWIVLFNWKKQASFYWCNFLVRGEVAFFMQKMGSLACGLVQGGEHWETLQGTESCVEVGGKWTLFRSELGCFSFLLNSGDDKDRSASCFSLAVCVTHIYQHFWSRHCPQPGFTC